MEDKTITELSYENIERIEESKRQLRFVVISCALFASFGLMLNASTYLYFSSLKGDTSAYIASTIIATMICIAIATFGAMKYKTLKNIGKRLEEFELLEETIYSEVILHR